MQVTLQAFVQDEDGHWVADLSCGHRQHLHHAPPWQDRAWVTTEAGRHSNLGTAIDCPYCDMGQIPAACAPYKRTKLFTESTIPAALTQEHRTKAAVWGRIVVNEGRLEYHCERGTFLLTPAAVGIVEPERPHHVRVVGPVKFYVEFLRAEVP